MKTLIKPITIIPANLPFHFERHGKVIKVWDAGDQVGVDFENCKNTVYFRNAFDAVRAINGYLFTQPLVVGNFETLVINQGYRDIEVLKINRTRARVSYEMPNAGMVEGWVNIFQTPDKSNHLALDAEQINRGY